ncbi:MAG: PIG-L family deacetylase [Planctomycetota bacterium]|jgi:LmbE family N-acetylglucosaminyl deacetylase
MKSLPIQGVLALAVLAPFVFASRAAAQQAEPEAGLVALHQALLDARTDAVVLNVAAHPDDEASRTNTMLRRKYGMRVVTAYTTFGDGGQNAIGREIGPELAYLRVRETLRAAAMSDVDVCWLGMEDFGFSKTLDETRAKWGDENLLAAMRRVVDEVDPDFVITNHTIAQGHGHHRATFWAIDTVLRERAAQQRYVPALLTRAKIEEAQWILDPAELEPLRGETYARLAHRAWVQHVTQGPWGPHNPLQVGRDWWKVANDDVRTVGGGEGAAKEMPWLWVPRAAAAERLAAGVERLPVGELSEAVRAQLRSIASAFATSPRDEAHARQLRAQHGQYEPLHQVLLSLANVRVEAWLERDEIATGGDGKANVVVHGAERLQDLQVTCGDRKGTPVTAPVRALVFDGLPVSPSMTLPQTEGVVAGATSANAPTSPGPTGRFHVAFPCEPPTGGPEPRFVELLVSFQLEGVWHAVRRRLPYTPVPPLDLTWDREVVLVPKGRTVERLFSVAVTSNTDGESSAPIRLGLPPGVQAVPLPTRLTLSREHSQARVLVKATIAADELSDTAGIEIGFGDVRTRLPLRAVDVSVPPGLKVALVRGPDDTTERTLSDLGVAFVALDRDALAMARLDEFSTVLLDIRAYHHRPELAEVRDRLLQFCRGGGRVVAMYHKPGEWNERAGHPLLAPFALVVGDGRVTEEDSTVTLLQPGHRLLQYPHTIAATDFDGWVQERGLNFAKTWDAAWTPLLAMADKGEEKPLEGSLLHTQYGRGDFVHCSLALYRQLRVGNAGAARLLVNLLAR